MVYIIQEEEVCVMIVVKETLINVSRSNRLEDLVVMHKCIRNMIYFFLLQRRCIQI